MNGTLQEISRLCWGLWPASFFRWEQRWKWSSRFLFPGFSPVHVRTQNDRNSLGEVGSALESRVWENIKVGDESPASFVCGNPVNATYSSIKPTLKKVRHNL